MTDIVIIPRADRATVQDQWASIDEGYSEQARSGSDVASRDLAAAAHYVYRNIYRIHQVDGRPQALTDLLNSRSRAHDEPPDTLGIYDLPSLNGLYLTSFLRRRSFTTATVKNFYTERERLAGLLADAGPVLVAVSSTFIYTDIEALTEISRFCRAVNPDATLVYGGASLYSLRNTFDPPDALERFLRRAGDLFDYFILAENGEQRLAEMLEALRDGRDPRRLANVAFLDGGGELVMNPPAPEDIDIDEEIIDWHLVDDDQLHPIAFSWTSRGCPFRCKFCNFFKIFEQTGFRSADSIRRELRTLVERNPHVEHVIFTDDNFGIGARRITELTRMLIEEDFGFRWSSFSRPDAINDQTIPLLVDAGCEALTFGVETADKQILKSILKASTPEKYRAAIQRSAEAGMFPIGSFILGLPGETEESVGRMIEFINGSGMKFLLPFVYHHQPDNDIYRDSEQHGIVGQGPTWAHGTMNSKEASDEFVRLFRALEGVVTDAPDVWGTFLSLRGQGHDAATIHRLAHLKNDLTRLELDGGEVDEEGRRRILTTFDAVAGRFPVPV